jgi:hypothetical protein
MQPLDCTGAQLDLTPVPVRRAAIVSAARMVRLLRSFRAIADARRALIRGSLRD